MTAALAMPLAAGAVPMAIGRDEDGEALVVTMAPVGPVAEAFREDRTFISTIMGPYGSAKTTTCFQKILNSALWQVPGRDGVRRVRWCCIRDTYSQLQTNVMSDWFSWFPQTKDNWNGEQMKHSLTLELPAFGSFEGGVIAIEMLFRAVGDYKAEQVFKGMPLTGLWMNEVDTLDREVLRFGMPRVGRYPAQKDGGCAWSGIIADMNAPDIDNWTYDLLVNKQLDIADELLAALQETYGADFGIAFHRQPGGLDPDAENLDNLPRGYYDRLQITMSDNEQRRFIHNQFGAVNNGQPVYPEFIDRLHVSANPIRAIPGVPIDFGLDGGSTPALVAVQRDEEGQLRVLGELVVYNPTRDSVLAKMGPTSFAKAAREWIDERWPKARLGTVWGDPAAFYGGDEEDLSWALAFGKEFKARPRPAPVRGNRVTPRIEAVRSLLVANRGGRPGLLLDPSCKVLRRGFNNGYVIQRIRLSDGSGRWRDAPDKNDHSHAQDALQYAAVGTAKHQGDGTRDLDRRARGRRANARVDYGNDYFAGRSS